MISTMRALVLGGLAMVALEAGAQSTPSRPIDLGLIPVGEERMFELRGRLNLDTASPEQITAAIQRIRFSVAQSSGFCVSAAAPAERTMLSLTGRERADSAVLFNLDTLPTGIAPGDGRRTIVQTIAPIAQTNLLLDAVVAQTAMAPGDALTVFVRSYPDQTPRNRLEQLCGPGLR